MKVCLNLDCPDLELLGVRGEYGDTVERCPRCGEPLAPAPATDTEPPPRATTFELAGRVANAALLPVAKSLLQAEGIAYVTRNEHTQEMVGWGSFGAGFNPVIGAVELWVDADRLEEAVELLGDLEEPATVIDGRDLAGEEP